MGAPRTQVSILVPTYNESQNIIGLLRSLAESIPKNIVAETIVIDDNSPDGTGQLVEDYIAAARKLANNTVGVLHRGAKRGLASAVLHGLRHARGDTIVVMDSDFSHPPSVIPRLLEPLRQRRCDIAVASRYAAGGAVQGWPPARRLLSWAATRVARAGLGVEQRDPMSGFFAFRRSLVQGLKLDGLGYKLLLEVLVKTRGARVAEVPYTFRDRRAGGSKLGARTAVAFARSAWRLYLHGRGAGGAGPAAGFLSKAARFYTVGASGLLVNYAVSVALAGAGGGLWYLHASAAGVAASVASNFALNKAWTFEDRDFSPRRTAAQLGKFAASSSAGALVQLGTVFALVEAQAAPYPAALALGVAAAAAGNFLLNKRWTFGERLWQ